MDFLFQHRAHRHLPLAWQRPMECTFLFLDLEGNDEDPLSLLRQPILRCTQDFVVDIVSPFPIRILHHGEPGLQSVSTTTSIKN